MTGSRRERAWVEMRPSATPGRWRRLCRQPLREGKLTTYAPSSGTSTRSCSASREPQLRSHCAEAILDALAGSVEVPTTSAGTGEAGIVFRYDAGLVEEADFEDSR